MLVRAAIQTNAVRLNTIIASEEILNKAIPYFKKEKNSYCESSQKMALERIRYSPACAVQEWFSG